MPAGRLSRYCRSAVLPKPARRSGPKPARGFSLAALFPGPYKPGKHKDRVGRGVTAGRSSVNTHTVDIHPRALAMRHRPTARWRLDFGNSRDLTRSRTPLADPAFP